VTDRARVNLWRVAILVALLGGWEWLTGIKAISRTPGLYWIDPFFISRPSAIARRFVYLASGEVRLSLWQMALSTVQSTLWGFVVGVSTGFVAGLVLGRNDRLARVLEPYIIAFNSLPRIALVPLVTMIVGFGLLAKVVLAWTIVFFIVFFNTFQGARAVDADLIHSARFLGASERQIMRTVIVPSACSIFIRAGTCCVSSPSGPLTITRPGESETLTPVGNSIGCLPIRLIRYQTKHTTSPPIPFSSAVRDVIRPVDVDRIATPIPPRTRGRRSLPA